jgi:hypothetical protein
MDCPLKASLSQIYLELDIRTGLGWIKTFYLLNESSIDIFIDWYDQLDKIILDTGLEISKINLQYTIIESLDTKFEIVNKFIEEFGRPFDLLEQIEDLEQIFTQELNTNSYIDLDTSSDTSSNASSDLYTQTETIGDIISAHIAGNKDKVIELLVSPNAYKIDDDEIISNLKKKYL